MVDLVDVGLMSANDARGRYRLNDTMRQLSEAIRAGLLLDIETTSGLDHVTVSSLRRCDAHVTGCRNASVVAESPARRPQQRPRAVTSSNYAVTSSRWRTALAELICLCFLSLCINRICFVENVTV